MEITKDLAKFIKNTNYDDIPKTTIEKMKWAIIDAVGCGLYGLTTEWGKKALQFTLDRPNSNETNLWGSLEKKSAMDAALEIGVLIHSFDYDDYHNAKVHPGAVVIPAALSVAEKVGASGKDLLTAIALGYETMTRVSLGTGPNSSRLQGWHLTGTTGTFGAAAAVGKLLDLSEEQMISSLGLAGTQSAGLWAFNADGAMSKRFHPGRSAQSGVISAFLALKGFTGPSQILEASDGGFCQATSDEPNLSEILRDIGEYYHAEDICFKPYSCCGSLHSSLDAIKEIMLKGEQDYTNIEQIRILNSEVVRIQTGWDYRPSTILNAQMSMKYCVASVAVFGDALVPQFTEETIVNPKILELVKKIDFIIDPEIDEIYPRKFSGKVEIDFSNGQKYNSYIEHPAGSPHNPMTETQLINKFKTSSQYALNASDIDRIVSIVLELESLEDSREIGEILSKAEVIG